MTLNERLDYFGQTVNIAARVQNLAGADEVCMTEGVYAAEGMAEILNSRRVEKSEAELKGVRGPVSVYRVVAA